MSALYLEADEDITSAVDKLKAAEESEVSIVVPKRSTLLQSMINLKLLKKAADDSKKDLILVTTDRLSSHLAGRVGLAVADKLGAEAQVPETELKEPDQTEVIDGGETGPTEPETKASEPKEAESSSEISGSADGGASEAEAAQENKSAKAVVAEPLMKTKAVSEDEPKPKKTKSGRVPDFNALQRRILWAGLAVGILIALFVLNFLLTSATVTIYAKGNQVPLATSFTADPGASATDVTKGILKAQALTGSKDLTEQVAATGKQDVGTKANGSVTIKNCEDTNSHILPAGATVASQGLSFVTTAAATIPLGSFSNGGKVCSSSQSVTVTVTAAQNGDKYNLAPASYTSPSLTSNYIITGTQMSGGVSKTVTVVQQSDIDGAVADMLSKDKDGGQQDLNKQAANGYKMLTATLVQTPSNITSDAAVGAQADKINVKVTAGYSALAVANSELDKFLTAQAIKQSGADNQVYDSGISNAQFSDAKPGTGAQTVAVNTNASVGPKMDLTAIATKIKGKKYGDANDYVNKLDGVDHATVSISPGWSTSMPSRTSRIKITVKIAGGGA